MEKNLSEGKSLGLGYLLKLVSVNICLFVMLLIGFISLEVFDIFTLLMLSGIYLLFVFRSEAGECDFEEETKDAHKFTTTVVVFAVMMNLLLVSNSVILCGIVCALFFRFRYHVFILLWEKNAREKLKGTFTNHYMIGHVLFYFMIVIMCGMFAGIRGYEYYVTSPQYLQKMAEEEARNTSTFVVDSVFTDVYNGYTRCFLVSEDQRIFCALSCNSTELVLTKKGDRVSWRVDKEGNMIDFKNLRFEINGDKIIKN